MEEAAFELALSNAMSKEEQAAKLYARMANIASNVQAKSFLLDMSKEEEMHKTMLENLQKRGTAEGIEFSKPLDMKLVDYLQPTKLDPDMNYQEALVYAANREKEAAEYYQQMAELVSEETARDLFSNLSKWELTHKACIEAEYEEHFLPEN